MPEREEVPRAPEPDGVLQVPRQVPRAPPERPQAQARPHQDHVVPVVQERHAAPRAVLVLTAPQEKYCQARARGLSQRQAYREAYPKSTLSLIHI